MDVPTAPATHTPGRRQRLAAVAKDIRARQPHVGQPMHGHTEHVQLFRTVRFRHTGRRRSQTLASGGTYRFIFYFLTIQRVCNFLKFVTPPHSPPGPCKCNPYTCFYTLYCAA